MGLATSYQAERKIVIINSFKSDGIEQLSGPVDTEVWGWEDLANLYVEAGEDPDTGEKTYRETDRIVVGKKVSIELYNNGDTKETLAFMLWYWGNDGSCGNVSSRLFGFDPGKTETITLEMEVPARAAWRLMRQ